MKSQDYLYAQDLPHGLPPLHVQKVLNEDDVIAESINNAAKVMPRAVPTNHDDLSNPPIDTSCPTCHRAQGQPHTLSCLALNHEDYVGGMFHE